MIVAALILAIALTTAILLIDVLQNRSQSAAATVVEYFEDEFVGEGWRPVPRLIKKVVLSFGFTAVLVTALVLAIVPNLLTSYQARGVPVLSSLEIVATFATVLQAIVTGMVSATMGQFSPAVELKASSLNDALEAGNITSEVYETQLLETLSAAPQTLAIKLLRADYRRGRLTRDAFVHAKKVVTHAIAYA